MNTLKLKISLLVLWMSTSFISLGQDFGKIGVRAGATMPQGILGTLVNPGKGFGIQINSTYFFQVRGRFTIDYAKYQSEGKSMLTDMYDYNLGERTPATLTFNRFSSVDATLGLDFKILPEKLPWFYCGPEVLIGADAANMEYVSQATGLIDASSEMFVHSAYKLNFGFEKSFGPINIFGEYAIMRMLTEYYDINAQNKTNGGMYHFINHKFTIGLKF